MPANMSLPTLEQTLLFKAVERELKKRMPNIDDAVVSIIVSRFVDGYDFNNGALAHKSARGWADMLISEYSLEKEEINFTDMECPEIKNGLDVEDIRRLREWNSIRHLNMSKEDVRKEYDDALEEALKYFHPKKIVR